MNLSIGLEGRVALVTGSGRGIGAAVAARLAADGAHVAVNDIDPDAARTTVKRINAAGAYAVAAIGSIAEPATCDTLVTAIEGKLGPVDILVSNAGVASEGRSVHRTEPDEVERLLRVHALGPFALCRRVLPGMRERRRGSIVVVSSQSTVHTPPYGAPYTMAKAALEALAMTIARENSSYSIRANIVAPGMVDTRLAQLVLARQSTASRPRHVGDVPGGLLDPDDVADVVAFLASDAARSVTGQRIGVDFGRKPDRPAAPTEDFARQGDQPHA